MITYVKGDATKPKDPNMADGFYGQSIIVHCCNNLGAWGSGFVVALSKKWPEPEGAYRRLFDSVKDDPGKRTAAGPFRRSLLGSTQIVRVDGEPGEHDIWVANVIGQDGVIDPVHNPKPLSYEALGCGLRHVADFARLHEATVHMPRIGCGLAGGSWAVVEGIIEASMLGLYVTVYDFPGGTFKP